MVENKLFRVSKLNDDKLLGDRTENIDKLESLAPSANGIIVSDFV